MVDIVKDNYINNEKDLAELLIAIEQKVISVERFRFKNVALKIKLLENLRIPLFEFEKKYYYIKDDLYISESEHDYLIVSTIGFVCYREKHKLLSEKFLGSLEVQYEVLALLIKEVKELLQKEDIMDIDSYSNYKLGKISVAIYNNILFYYELFGKSYLSLNNVDFNKTHKLKSIYKSVVKVMWDKKHNDTLFHALIITEIKKLIEYLDDLGVYFREEFVKYDDNVSDCTIVLITRINEIEKLLLYSDDFIFGFKYEKEKMHLLKTGLYQRLISRCKNQEERNEIQKVYGYLIKKIKI